MSSVAISGNAGGSGVFTVASPSSSSSYTATLPAATTTLVGTDATQTLTNKTLTSPTISSPAISSPTISGTPTGVGIITYDTAKASTSGTTIDFTGIPSWVKRVVVMLNGVSTTGISPYIVQLGYSGGFTGATYNSSNTGATSGVSSVTTTVGLYLVGSPGGGGSGAAGLFNGAMTLTNFSGNTWVSTATVAQNSVAHTNWSAGIATAGGVLTQIRITTVGGTETFDAGSINIMYE